MGNEMNLKPFVKGYDPRRNIQGTRDKSIAKILREFGEYKEISYNIVLTNQDGTEKAIQGKIRGKGKAGSLNQLIATRLMIKAVMGDLRAIHTVLDRTEGKPKQALEVDNLPLNSTIEVTYGNKK
jgi:hypothetical protein